MKSIRKKPENPKTSPEEMNWWKSFLIPALVSLAVSVGGVFITDWISDSRTAKQQVAFEYVSRDPQLTSLGTKYIAAITTGSSVEPLKVDIRATIADEIAKSEGLRDTFAEANPSIEKYQWALQRFSETLVQANDATSMRPWVEAFGGVIDAKAILDRDLKKIVGV